MTTGYSKLSKIISEEYEVGPMVASQEAVIWSFELLVEDIGEEDARSQLSAFNARREEIGKRPVYVS